MRLIQDTEDLTTRLIRRSEPSNSFLDRLYPRNQTISSVLNTAMYLLAFTSVAIKLSEQEKDSYNPIHLLGPFLGFIGMLTSMLTTERPQSADEIEEQKEMTNKEYNKLVLKKSFLPISFPITVDQRRFFSLTHLTAQTTTWTTWCIEGQNPVFSLVILSNVITSTCLSYPVRNSSGWILNGATTSIVSSTFLIRDLANSDYSTISYIVISANAISVISSLFATSINIREHIPAIKASDGFINKCKALVTGDPIQVA